MIFRRSPRPPSTPSRLREARESLQHLHSHPAPKLDVTQIRDKVMGMIATMAPDRRRAAEPALHAYVDTYLTDWLSEARTGHNKLLNEIDRIAGQVGEVRAMYLTLHEDQSAVLGDLERAVSHALERVSDPDSPYFEPVSRQQHRGGRP
jgi:hypothetical protein